MTFQEAQVQFSAVVGRVEDAMTSGDLTAIQRDLIAMQDRLPLSAEFDLIAEAIAEFSPKLTGPTAKAVLHALGRKNATLRHAAALLTRVEAVAQNDSRVFTVEHPAVIAAGLTHAIETLQGLQGAVKAGDLEQVAADAEALTPLVQHLLGTIRAT
jgi:hypothetical protein